MTGKMARQLTEAGVQVRYFEPLFRSRHFYFGRRLHHKVMVTDGLYSLVGGMNICDRYNDMPGAPAWLDTAVYCEGEASFLLQQICRDLWGDRHLPIAGKDEVERFCDAIPEEEQITVRIRRNDWVKRRMQIWKTYLDLFNKAEGTITILCSYFIPGRMFRRRIKQAVKRGVKVRVILAGRSDIAMAKHAERFLYDWMMRHGIEIYEYQPSILHAKMGVYDGRMTTIGSYNVNNISAYASLELNLNVYNHSFARYIEAELDRIMREQCKKITRENFTRTENIFRIAWQRFCFSFINNVLNLFTFYFRQE
jgi:cardiolipin synthase